MSQSPTAPAAAPIILRILLWIFWSIFLGAGLSFAAVLALVLKHARPGTPPDPEHIRVFSTIALIGGTFVISSFHILRWWLFRRLLRSGSWIGLTITYMLGKFVTWAACNGVMYFCLVICIIAQSFMPALPIAAAAWLVIAIDPPLFRPLSILDRSAKSHPNLPRAI